MTAGCVGAVGLAAWALVAAGCARDLRVRLPGDPGAPTGSITVVVTQPARDLTVAVNGVLVAERRHTARVRVDNVPEGMADVVVAAGAGGARLERHVRVEVEAGRDTAIPVGSPTDSTSRTLVMTVISVALWLILR